MPTGPSPKRQQGNIQDLAEKLIWSQPPADVLFGIEAPASPAHRLRCQHAFVVSRVGGPVWVPVPSPNSEPPGTYEISAHLIPNPALHTEEGAGPEIQVVISDPSSSHARGQAQAAEPLKPRQPQKQRIREIDETAAFQNRIPLNTKTAVDPNTRTERCQSDPPQRQQGNILDLTENICSSASGGCSFWDRGAGFAGAPTSLPAGLCFSRVGGPAWVPVPSPNSEPPGTYDISAHLLPNPALHTEEGAGPEIQVVISDPISSHARGQAQAAESLKPRKPQKPRIRDIDETAAFQNRIPLNRKSR